MIYEKLPVKTIGPSGHCHIPPTSPTFHVDVLLALPTIESQFQTELVSLQRPGLLKIQPHGGFPHGIQWPI